MLNQTNFFWLIKLPRVCLVLFIFLQILSMIFYPGGTYFNQMCVGYSFTRNFLSDLGRLNSFSLENNFLSCQLFNMSLIIAGIVFIMFYYYLKDIVVLYNYKFIAIAGSFFGFLGGIFLILVGLTPSDLYFSLHVLSAKWLFRVFFLSSICQFIAIHNSMKFQNKFSFGYAAFAISLLIYIAISEFGPSPQASEIALTIQVVSQKIILLIMFFSIYLQTKSIMNLDLKFSKI